MATSMLFGLGVAAPVATHAQGSKILVACFSRSGDLG